MFAMSATNRAAEDYEWDIGRVSAIYLGRVSNSTHWLCFDGSVYISKSDRNAPLARKTRSFLSLHISFAQCQSNSSVFWIDFDDEGFHLLAFGDNILDAADRLI